MKLELKHLAPYLPYGLKGNYELSDVVPTAKHELRDKELRIDCVDFFLKYAKPILRPLSDLKKINKLSTIKFYVNGNFYIDSEYWKVQRNAFEYLFKHHFDVFGLIEQNLAIDINTVGGL